MTEGKHPVENESSLTDNDWDDYNRLKATQTAYLGGAETEKLLAHSDKVLNLDQQLRQNYPAIKRQEVLFWHLMSGSTPEPSGVSRRDYPGGEIETFLLKELAQDTG